MDFDGDGRKDLLSGSISGKVYLYRRKANGAFQPGETLKLNMSSSSERGSDISLGSGSAVCMADWFNRGKLDLFVGTGDGSVFLLRNDGSREKPRFTRAQQLKVGKKVISADGGLAGPCVVDWDGDGLQDLLVGSGSGKVVFYRNTGTKEEPELGQPVTLVDAAPDTESRAKAENPKRSGQDARICAADWNGDGKLDLIVGDRVLVRTGDSNRFQVHGWVWVYLRTGGAVETSSLK